MLAGLAADVRAEADVLIGRERETRVLDALVSHVRERGVAVLAHGQAGVGKSTLLSAVSSCAGERGMVACSISGGRAEAHVPFAGLHQMLRPLLERAQNFARPQREMLLASFGKDQSASGNSFAVAMATLELLAQVGRTTPLIVTIDDAHWLDVQTTQVLGYVARRLGPEPIALLMTVREGYPTTLFDFDIPELHIGPLDDASAATLLDLRAPGLSPRLRARVMAEAAGNPLALVELAAAGHSNGPVFGQPERLPMTERLTRAFSERFLFLPEKTQTALLVASLDEEITLNEVAAATSLLDDGTRVSIDDLAPAVNSGLVGQDDRQLRFCHPLIPAVIYQTESVSRRRRAHAGLASVSDDSTRRVWHAAAAIEGPDEEIANELDAATLHSHAWTQPSRRAAAMQRAAELTPAGGVRQRRFLRAAEMALVLGDTDQVEQLLDAVDPDSLRPLDCTRTRVLNDMIHAGYITDLATIDSLVEAAGQAAAESKPDLALQLLQVAATQAWWAGLKTDVRARIADAVKALAAPEFEPRALCILAMTDPESAIELLHKVGSQTPPTACDAHTAYALGTALHVTGMFDRSAVFLDQALPRLRRRGSLWLLPHALVQQAWNAVYVAKWDFAAATAEEAADLARDLGQPVCEAAAQTALAVISAMQGDETTAEKALASAESIAVPLEVRAVLADVQLARAVIALGAGRHEEAFEHLQRTFDPKDPAHHYVRSAWRIGELAEAALQAGRIDEAQQQLARCERNALRTFSPRLKVGLLYARSILADPREAEALFQAALSSDLASWPLYRARLLLQYGMWLRRHRKVAQARLPLRSARDSLSALRAGAWVERARQELRASRETQHIEAGSWMQLTEQELQIAQLAAEGLTNQEIGQRLYISHRTVGSHLYRIFPKLGISSRAQLSTALRDSSPIPAAY